MKKNKRCILLLTAFFMAMLLTACANPFRSQSGPEPETASPTPERADTGFVLTGPESYDSADTAVLVGRNGDENTVTFLNLELGRKYTLSLDGTTGLYDKYGEGISLDQVHLGDVVDITFLKSKKHLTTLRLSSKSWILENVERYEINPVRSEVTIGSETYKLTSNTQYLAEGMALDMMDLNPADIVSFLGIDTQILTVRVEKGHGYLRLANDENFIGGWIEVGAAQIRQITEDMLLLVPEGSYQVNISHRGGGGVKSVVINRNEETLLDIGDLEIPEPQYGIVLFSLDPSSADLYIDGTQVDVSGPVSLEYGVHQMIARAEGYQSVTQYIRVAEASASINVVLEASRSEEEEEETPDPSAPIATDYYKVYVDAPEGAEVYLDGNYMGISPCSFRKTAGAHVITLRKTGYETRSYTVQVDEENKDISYSFADLSPGTASLTDTLLDAVLP